MNPRLQGYAAAVLEEAGTAGRARLAGELAAVERQFATNADLLTALTDTSNVAAARRAVMADLLEGKVSPDAARLAAYAAYSARPATEVPAAITWAAHRARRAAEGLEEHEPSLGHMDARERVGGYAAAVFEELPTDRLEEVEDQLFRFARTIETTPVLRGALTDRDLPVAVRRGVVDDLLGDKVDPATLRLADYAVTGGRPRDIVGTLFRLVDLTAEARGWRVALVVAAREVPEEERRRLAESLSRLAGWPVQLQVTIDPALLAGVRVRIGDLQVEASARDRLEQLREHVVSGGWEDQGFQELGRGGND
ncbi:MAG: F0F1 ATP synthase subunit delta [Acidimicrobiales bacterium]